MGYVRQLETDEVTLPSDPQWKVTLKREALYADEQRVDNALLFTTSPATGVNPEDITAYVQARTLTMIVDWNLTDTDDSPLPVNATTLALLSKEDGKFLMLETKKRYEGRPEEETAPFGKPSGTRSRVTASATSEPSEG